MSKIILGIIIAISLIVGIYYIIAKQGKPEGPYFCTKEVRLCSDGSYVGRTGPNCEFSACPRPQPLY